MKIDACVTIIENKRNGKNKLFIISNIKRPAASMTNNDQNKLLTLAINHLISGICIKLVFAQENM